MTPEQIAAPALPLHPQDEMECRRCGVHCDKVVYPGACLARGCPFVYSYEAWGHTYVGCMQKVYEVEIDLDMLRAAEAAASRASARSARCGSRCRCARPRSSGPTSRAREELGCINPEFDELPVGEPTFRVFAAASRPAEQRVLAAPADRRATTSQTSSDAARRAARRARARRPRRSRASVNATPRPCSGPCPCFGRRRDGLASRGAASTVA